VNGLQAFDRYALGALTHEQRRRWGIARSLAMWKARRRGMSWNAIATIVGLQTGHVRKIVGSVERKATRIAEQGAAAQPTTEDTP
jgi:hypothetical protein